MGVSIDDLPEPLRHAVLPERAGLAGLLLALLLVAALVQQTAAWPGLRLRGPQLAGLALLLGLAATPWLDSLLWLPLVWVGFTWAGLLCQLQVSDGREHGSPQPLVSAVGRAWLRQGLLADGLCTLACAACFWGQAGTWSRAGAGFVVTVPPQTTVEQTTVEQAATHIVEELPSPKLRLHDLAPPAEIAQGGPGPLRSLLRHKVFFGLPLDWLVLALFLIALSLKLNMGLRLARAGLGRAVGVTASQRLLWLLPALASPLLALQTWLGLRGQW